MQLSNKHKQILRWAGYPLLAVVTFVFAAHCTFPYERVKDRYIIEALSDKYDVSVVSVERSFWPGGMILRSVALRTRPTAPDEKPTTLFFDEIRLDLGLFAMLGGKVSVDIEAAIGGGAIEGTVEASKSEVRVSFHTEALPLANLPGVREAVGGLPMSGGLHADIDVTLAEGRWDKAEGTISLSCPGCTMGDGEAKIKPRARPGRRVSARMNAFAGDGMTVPNLNLGDLSASIKIAGGRGVVEDFQARSPDGEMAVQAVIRFGRQFKESSFESGCMKFKLSESLKQREPNFGNLPELMRMAPQPDGFSNVKLTGRLITMRWVPAQSCDASGDDDERVSRRNSRPSIPSRRPELPAPAVGPETEPPGEPMTLTPTRDVGSRDDGGDGEQEGAMPEPRTSGPPIAPERPRRPDDVQIGSPEQGLVKPELEPEDDGRDDGDERDDRDHGDDGDDDGDDYRDDVRGDDRDDYRGDEEEPLRQGDEPYER